MMDIETQVCADIAARQELGINKYGMTVAENPLELREWLNHAYLEALDLAIYLRRAMAEIDATSKLDAAKAVCRAHGFAVFAAGKWMKPHELGASLGGMPSSTLHKLLHRIDCPEFERQTGPGGRISRIRETVILRAWLKRNWTPRGKE
jgi:hypothetical protein